MRPFEPALHVSPFRLFRRLREAREGAVPAPRLLDLRRTVEPGELWLDGARPFSELELHGETDDVVLVDQYGHGATELARRLQAEGHAVRALYGGLTLYDFALDPAVVGEERFLTRR